MKRKENTVGNDFKITIIIFQTIVFTVLVLAMLLLRTVGGKFYKAVRAEYVKHFEEHTNVDDLMKDADENFEEKYKVFVE
ncbi:MAG: hypothetical protein IJ426_00670 [Clostridia bacterium]|nr:hypothetical protein [Clostridia bacterium]